MKAWRLVCLCGCVLLLACADDDKGASPDATGLFDINPPEVSVDLRAADLQALPDAAATTTLTGKIRYLGGMSPVSDMDVCLYKDGQKTTQCTKTNAQGEWSLEVPMNAEIGLLFDKDGVEDSFQPLYLTKPPTSWNWWTWTDALATTGYAKVGVSYPPTDKGHIFVAGGGGVQIAVVPQAGVGPYYGLADFDKSLTQAPDDGWGEIMDLPPGTYDVDVTHASKTCTDAIGWPPNPGHTLRLPVLAGHVTSGIVSCK